ncbi:WD40 repeat-like protein [Rhodofomes roseus]|uniref:Pre-rRNA-processing protein IPI3 n=1 Tax=Rhodofomes roseus TaxID=34475 RepID=A0ABQ8KNI2_9APHY|nr:WD40 repeat-like protein [Rhodofomes roseus]KAH9839891.1 WD40 repeat-like protein [Rhodofomes roseus]
MHLHECILCATGPSSSTPGPGAISLHDIQTGTSLASFKQTSAAPRCTAVVQSRDGLGGFMLAAQSDKSIMNVYNYQKDQLALKIVLPEKLSAIAVDPQGEFCAGGTVQGRIFLWEVASGIMYNAWDAHYRQVNVLRFTQDGAALISGSDDSSVSVWSVSRLLDNDLQNDLPTPYCNLSDHSLPITDILCGAGSFPSCRILTSSADHTAKLWDLSSKTLLTTFHFPQPIACLVWDATERLFFAGSADGSIHQVNLFRQREDKFGRAAMEAVGGGGVNDMIRINDEDPQAAKKRLISVGQPVTTMSISLTSSLLLVGTATGHIHTYDIASHQLLRTLSTHKGMVITHLMTLLRPPDLVGHVSLTLAAGTETKEVPVRPIAPFQRMRDAKARDLHEVAMMLPPQPASKSEVFFSYSREELLRDHSFFVQTGAGGPGEAPPAGAAAQARVLELEAEVARLREQLGKAKGMNDTMWETVVKQIVHEKKDKVAANGQAEEDPEEAVRRKKRGRT